MTLPIQTTQQSIDDNNARAVPAVAAISQPEANLVIIAANALLHRGDDGGVPINRNDVGYNKVDYGQVKALLARFDREQEASPQWLGYLLVILRKYRRQLTEMGYADLEPLSQAAAAGWVGKKPEPKRDAIDRELDRFFGREEAAVERSGKATETAREARPRKQITLPAMSDILGPGGVIAQALPGYESRPTQVELATAIAGAISNGDSILAEAGTGTGKSLAYLIPAIYSQQKTIVSTEGKALQDQLAGKDLPFLASVLPIRFQFSVLKGISNYLCELKWDEESNNLITLPGLEGLTAWREMTQTGDLTEAPIRILPELHAAITTTTDDCLGRQCGYADRCWVLRAKRRAEEAQVLVVNHTLLCLDLALRDKTGDGISILPDRDLIFTDECFVAGTSVDDVPIESIGTGDFIHAFNETTHQLELKRVTRTFRKEAPKTLVRLSINGHSIICTPNHPFLTVSSGWKRADQLSPMDLLVRFDGKGNFDYLQPLRQSVRDHEQQAEMQLQESRPSVLLNHLRTNSTVTRGRASVEGEAETGISRAYAAQEPNAGSCGQRESEDDPARDELAPASSPRQWNRLDGASTASIGSIGLAVRGNGIDRLPQEQSGAHSRGLQDRCCESGLEDSRRGRWSIAQRAGETSTGYQENGRLVWAWVDRVEVLKSGGDPTFGGLCRDGVVYNLEVEGLHTYLVDGMVVHNCHSIEDVATKAFTEEVSEHAVASATRAKLANLADLSDEDIAKVRQLSDEFFKIVGRDERSTYRIEPSEDLALKADAIAEILHAMARQSRQMILDQGLAGYEAGGINGLAALPNVNEPLNRQSILGATKGERQANLRRELYACRLENLADKFAKCVEVLATHVIYVEKTRDYRDQTRVTLKRAPINVADDLASALWNKWPVVATSATLTTGTGFAFFKERTGCSDARELSVESPFDFQRNALMYLPRDGGLFDPSKFYQDGSGSVAYFDRLADEIEKLLLASDGRAFCLFTSRKALDEVYRRLDSRLKWTVLRQGDYGVAETIRRFKSDGHAVLFGLKSFWTGVDVQGEALSLVIIDKLPFAMPDDPIFEARKDDLTRRTGDKWAWFNRLAIPTATISLKQAAGRLIRSTTDRGVIALLEGRLTTKGYGTGILRSLPPARQVRSMDAVKEFFDGGR